MKSSNGSVNYGTIALIAIIYLALMAAAWWYFTKNKTTDIQPLNGSSSVGSTIDFNNGGLLNTGTARSNVNTNGPEIPPIVPVNLTSNQIPEVNTGSQNSASKAIQYRQNEFYANKAWRASISYPGDGSLVNSDNGWVNVQGNIEQSNLGESLFVVVESTTQDPPMIYLQRELQLTDEGFWTANVKYGSLGYEYLTYVIAANNEISANTVRQLGQFTDFPVGVEIISKPSLNLIK